MASTNPKTYESTPSRKVAFLGLGVMGFPMAGHLALAGHQVTVYNRSAEKREAWSQGVHGGSAAATPREAAAGADSCSACVGNDDDLRSVVLGEQGAFAGMKPGAVFVDHTTASADVARELAAEAKKRRPAVRRRAGLRRPGRRAERHAHRDVRRRAGRLRRGAAGGHGLLPRLHAAGRERRGPARQDGQPDRHRRAGAGPVGSHRLRQKAGLDMEQVLGGDRQGRGAELADGQPRQDHDRRQVRLRLRGRLDAQGPRPGAWRRPSATARACRSRRWSTSSTPTCRPWAAPLGHLQPDQAACARRGAALRPWLPASAHRRGDRAARSAPFSAPASARRRWLAPGAWPGPATGHRGRRDARGGRPAAGVMPAARSSSGLSTSKTRTTRCTPAIWRAMEVARSASRGRHPAHQVHGAALGDHPEGVGCRSEASTKEARTLPVMKVSLERWVSEVGAITASSLTTERTLSTRETTCSACWRVRRWAPRRSAAPGGCSW